MATVAEMIAPLRRRLVEAARRGEVVTYGALAADVGTVARVVPQALKVIQRDCRDADIPDLTAVVVAKGTGRPGGGFFAPYGMVDPATKWPLELGRVYRHRWPDPTAD